LQRYEMVLTACSGLTLSAFVFLYVTLAVMCKLMLLTASVKFILSSL
jgi:hypothetical protein